MPLRRPNYANVSPGGQLTALFCKVCGATIGDSPRGSFRHRPTYAEMEIVFQDGSRHIANGCRTCLDLAAENTALQQEIYAADVAFRPLDFTERDKARQI